MSDEYTRDELVAICERAVVDQSKWWDRDSAKSQEKVGACWALLKAGCEFEVQRGVGNCVTDEETIWVRVFPRGFQSFELGDEEGRDPDSRLYYLPTDARLDRADGKDWY